MMAMKRKSDATVEWTKGMFDAQWSAAQSRGAYIQDWLAQSDAAGIAKIEQMLEGTSFIYAEGSEQGRDVDLKTQQFFTLLGR